MIGKLPMCYLCDITHNTQPTVSSMYKHGPTDYEFVGLPRGADHQPTIQAYAQHSLSASTLPQCCTGRAYAPSLSPAPWGGPAPLTPICGVLEPPLPKESFSCTDHIAVPRNHRASDIPGGPIARLHGVMDKTRCGKSRLSSKPAPQPPCIKLTTGITGSK